MMETPSTSKEEPEVCSKDSLQELCKKKSRVLFISTDEKRKEFTQKFVNAVGPKDVAIFDTRTDNSCEVVEYLGLDKKPAAILIENGEITGRFDLQNDDVQDTVGLTKMLQTAKDPDSCKVQLQVDGGGWRLNPESSTECKRTLSNIEKLGPETRKYLKKHI